MICHSCNREMYESTIRYHTPLGYERKMVVYECEYDSCSGQDYTESEVELAALRPLLKEAGEALKPFAHADLSEKLAGNFDGDGSIIFQRNNAIITLGDARRAADIARKIKELG